MKLTFFNENQIQITKGNPYVVKSLSPPPEATLINHPSEYIYNIDKKGRHLRRIFYNQEFTQYEKEQIQEYRKLLADNNVVLPTEWSDLKILKYIYNEQFDKKSFLTQVKKHIDWLNNYAMQNPSEETLEKYLSSGVMYTFGRDNQFRPIVFVNSYQIKVDSNNIDEMNGVNGALCRLLSIVQKNMFLEGKIENWIIGIDTGNCGLTELDFRVIGKIIECMVANYTCILHKLFILNPSWSFRQCWKIISAFIPSDSQDKIEFITKDDFHKLPSMGINSDQVQQKYGGSHEDLTYFWPPKNNEIQESKFATPSRRDSSHYHSMIDHSNFISRQASQREINDQELTQDQNTNSRNILEEQEILEDKKTIKHRVKFNIPKQTEILTDKLEQPHLQSTSGCCSQNSCSIF